MAEKLLTPVQEDYLALIFEEQSAKGTARGCSIVQQKGVTRGTVAATLRSMKEAGLVTYQPYGPITLTEPGLRHARRICARRRIIEDFFTQSMMLNPDEARELAREIARTADDEVIHRFQKPPFSPQKARISLSNAQRFTECPERSEPHKNLSPQRARHARP